MKSIIIMLMLTALYSPIIIAGEQLDWVIPDGWKVGYQKANMIELVKNDESVENWTRLITFQQYESSEKTNGITWIERMEEGFIGSCADVEVILLEDGFHGGYEIVHAILFCTINKANGKGEVVQIKKIKGKERFFVVQYAYRVEAFKRGGISLEGAEMKRAIDYVAKLSIVNR